MMTIETPDSDSDKPEYAYDLTSTPKDHPVVARGRIGVLLVNLGTPEATSYWPMRRYLKEFLSDRRVIEVNRVVWWLVLNLIILTTRPTKSGHAYAQIWNQQLDESPLKTITRGQSAKLAHRFSGDERIMVDWAMRYGKPELAEAIERLHNKGCERILLCPLYPQYSATTTATVYDAAFAKLQKMRWQPTLRGLPPYHDEPRYIAAIAHSIRQHIKRLSWTPDKVIASFHGLPKEYLLNGDPYYCHCHKTIRLLREELEMDEESLMLAFQSRFGKAEWLQPYCDETVAKLAQQGVKNLVVVTPGFVADCVETLEEIKLGLAETFTENGGEKFSVVECLNDSTPAIDLLENLVRRELQGWL